MLARNLIDWLIESPAVCDVDVAAAVVVTVQFSAELSFRIDCTTITSIIIIIIIRLDPSPPLGYISYISFCMIAFLTFLLPTLPLCHLFTLLIYSAAIATD